MGYERVHMKEEKEDFFQIHNMCIVERTERRRDDEKKIESNNNNIMKR